MSGTYSQVLLHIVFSTKHRTPWITPDIVQRLYPYIGGIIRAEKGTLYDIGGVEDHVHLVPALEARRLRIGFDAHRQSTIIEVGPRHVSCP